MKILRLQSENVKRLHAVDITPDPEAAVITVGGKNGNGKSSTMDSIAMAIGGAQLAPVEPIRAGETEAKIVVDLGEYVVTRKFTRPKIHTVDCGSKLDAPIGGQKAPCNCQPTFGPTISTLVVTNKDGAKYPTPQSLLDKLCGNLTFDPQAFATADEKQQAAILRRIVGLDTTELDEARKTAFAFRADLNKQLKQQETLLKAMPVYIGIPDAEIPASEVSAEMLRAEQKRNEAEQAERNAARANETAASTERNLNGLYASIERLQKQLAEAQDAAAKEEEQWKRQTAAAEIASAQAVTSRSLVPSVEVIRQKLADIEDTNKKVRANAAQKNVQAAVAKLELAAETKTSEIASIDAKKSKLLLEAKFPILGLGLSDDGVTFEGAPFAQAGTAAQLRASVAIGLALNPKLKVMLVKNGNALDEDSMKLLAAMAAEASAQVWIEWVTSDAKQVSVMIEDGHVAQ